MTCLFIPGLIYALIMNYSINYSKFFFYDVINVKRLYKF